ncbi:hypothetical protein BS50DRAFT_605398 [Corynespora cassiicola Philippines]|uniref:Uncharacterized protein n=1 Tax=Corynespora cassiicola Philippines TaxID=1448308 RepID=A0A2T2N110_CORCC|nr:hypothetical protein BS50DRAFT_605398 [Corynespora cassiicola Philippines]
MSIPTETNNCDVTSWIPLTSIFTPSSGCESIFRFNGPSLVAFDPGYGLDIDTQVKCAPSAVTTWWEQARMGNGGNEHTVVSIQPLICPSDWTTIMCCPSGYRLAHATPGPVNGDCISNLRSGMKLTYAWTPKNSPSEWEITNTKMEFSSSAGAIAVVGYNVDCPESTTSHSVTEASTITLPNPTPTPTLPLPDTTFISSSPDSKNNGLSVGAKIRIGIGSSLGGIGVSALVIAMLIIRKRYKKSINISAGRGALEVESMYELPDDARVDEMPSENQRSPVELS